MGTPYYLPIENNHYGIGCDRIITAYRKHGFQYTRGDTVLRNRLIGKRNGNCAIKNDGSIVGSQMMKSKNMGVDYIRMFYDNTQVSESSFFFIPFGQGVFGRHVTHENVFLASVCF